MMEDDELMFKNAKNGNKKHLEREIIELEMMSYIKQIDDIKEKSDSDSNMLAEMEKDMKRLTE